METLSTYQNGNTTVSILRDGTKIREYKGEPVIVFPESIDVKITDYCDMGCSYCHESSTTKGVHGNLALLLDKLKDLPAGVELAIGGGNPLSHPNLIEFLCALKERGIIANITINQGHLKTFQNLIQVLVAEDLVKGVGISVTSNNFKHLLPILKASSNVVYHVIAGVNDVAIMDKLISISVYCKVLILGYKHFGFGVQYYSDSVQANLKEWRKYLRGYIGKCTMSFDNLAIEQLNVRKLFTTEGWNRFYMGDDFTFTMYIDAVKQEFAPTSRSKNRASFSHYSLCEYFTQFRNQPPPALKAGIKRNV